MKETEIKAYFRNKFKDTQKLFLAIKEQMNELDEEKPEHVQTKYALSVDYGYLLIKMQEIRDSSARITGDDFDDIIDPEVKAYCQTAKTVFYIHPKDGIKTVANDIPLEEIVTKIKEKISGK